MRSDARTSVVHPELMVRQCGELQLLIVCWACQQLSNHARVINFCDTSRAHHTLTADDPRSLSQLCQASSSIAECCTSVVVMHRKANNWAVDATWCGLFLCSPDTGHQVLTWLEMPAHVELSRKLPCREEERRQEGADCASQHPRGRSVPRWHLP